MSDIARLKNQARGHEAKEEWSKAIHCYVQAIRLAEGGGVEGDLVLYNRVGDLLQKTSQTTQAVEYWERGVDAYMEAGFYNNAIALCNKILRTSPGRNSIYLKLGQISARKGFLSEARKNILEYAERMQRSGQLDEAFRALQRFADLQPEPEIRIMLADQLLAHKRVTAGVDQLRYAWRDLVAQGRQADAEEIRNRILELAPDRDPEVDRPEGVTRPAEPTEFDVEGIIELPELEAAGPAEPVSAGPPETAPPEPEAEVAEAPSPEAELERVEPVEVEGAAEAAALDLEGGEAAPPTEEELRVEDLDLQPKAEDRPEDAAPPETEPVEVEPVDVEPTAFEFDTLIGEGIALGSTELTGPEAETAEGEEGEGEGKGEGEGEGLSIEVPEGLTFDLGDFEFELTPATEEEAQVDVTGLDFEAGLTPADTAGAAPTDTSMEAVEELPIIEPGEAPDTTETTVPAVESLDEYRERLREDPEDHDLRTRLAELLLEEGRRAEALRELRRALEGYESQGKVREADFVAEELLRLNPNDVRVHQKRVELAFLQQERGRLIQAYLDLADCLDRTEASEKAGAVYERVLELDAGNERALRALELMGGGERPVEPVAEGAEGSPGAQGTGGEFVDLGSILRAEEPPASTQFRVRVTEPGAEDEFDFAEMLAQFRSKVAETVTQEDYASHYDLGIAYKEMGLTDEAISEFQIAARGEGHRLRAQEMLGRCFLEKGEYRVAQKVLLRALESGGDPGALVGVFYDLGRVHEALGEPQRALEFYERAFSVDIGFQDVAARIRSLRKKA